MRDYGGQKGALYNKIYNSGFVFKRYGQVIYDLAENRLFYCLVKQ